MATLPILDLVQNLPEVRPLSSPGITRLQRYYGPLRHPTPPSLSLAGVRLMVLPTTAWGFPCFVTSPSCPHAVATTPASPSLASFIHNDVSGLPHGSTGSALALRVSRLAQRSLALRPVDSQNRLAILSTEGSVRLVASPDASVATG